MWESVKTLACKCQALLTMALARVLSYGIVLLVIIAALPHFLAFQLGESQRTQGADPLAVPEATSDPKAGKHRPKAPTTLT